MPPYLFLCSPFQYDSLRRMFIPGWMSRILSRRPMDAWMRYRRDDSSIWMLKVRWVGRSQRFWDLRDLALVSCVPLVAMQNVPWPVELMTRLISLPGGGPAGASREGGSC